MGCNGLRADVGPGLATSGHPANVPFPVITEPETKAIFSISPAARSALIIGGFLLVFILMSVFWVAREALRIQRERLATSAASAGISGSGMVWIPAGGYTRGGVGEVVPWDEQPLHDVRLPGFWIDKTEVTNEQFARFVAATGYVTTAERPRQASTTRGLPAALAGQAASLGLRPAEAGEKGEPIWGWVAGADWRHPGGPATDLQGREKHPVVHIAYEDATAYAQWAGQRLPTEAEWEYAARGGLVSMPYVWGAALRPGGKWMANVWQGAFPGERRVEDGFDGSAPVASFPANGYGLYDMAGNVWEIARDWYRPDLYAALKKNPDRLARRNPQGPPVGFDPDEPDVPKKALRGGAWTSSDAGPLTFHPSSRSQLAPGVSRQDTGFRCVKER